MSPDPITARLLEEKFRCWLIEKCHILVVHEDSLDSELSFLAEVMAHSATTKHLHAFFRSGRSRRRPPLSILPKLA